MSHDKLNNSQRFSELTGQNGLQQKEATHNSLGFSFLLFLDNASFVVERGPNGQGDAIFYHYHVCSRARGRNRNSSVRQPVL